MPNGGAGSAATGALGSSGTFMCSWSTIGVSSRAMARITGGTTYFFARANSVPPGSASGAYGSVVSSNNSFENVNVFWSVAMLLSFMYERPCVAPKSPLCKWRAMSSRKRSSTIAARFASSGSGANSTSVSSGVTSFW